MAYFIPTQALVIGAGAIQALLVSPRNLEIAAPLAVHSVRGRSPCVMLSAGLAAIICAHSAYVEATTTSFTRFLLFSVIDVDLEETYRGQSGGGTRLIRWVLHAFKTRVAWRAWGSRSQDRGTPARGG